MNTLPEVFTSVVLAALLILTAWGSAFAMLVFSATALLAVIALPCLRGRLPPRDGLLVGLLGAAVGPRLSFVWAGMAALAVTVVLGVRIRAALKARPIPLPQ